MEAKSKLNYQLEVIMITAKEIERLWIFKWDEAVELYQYFRKTVEKPLPTVKFTYIDDFYDLEYILFWDEWLNNVTDLNPYMLGLCNKVASELQFFISKKERLKFIEDRTKQLRQNFQENKLNHLFNFADFQVQMFDDTFIDDVYEDYETKIHDKLMEWYQDKNPYQSRPAGSIKMKCKEILKNNFFADFEKIIKILAEIKLLQLIFIKMEGQKELVDFDYSPYPMVFTTGYGYQLFNFLLSLEPTRKKRPSFISKYFYLFRKEELIEENARWSDFFRYLDEEHNIDNIKRIDERAQPDDDEFNYFEKIKKNFSLKYTSIN